MIQVFSALTHLSQFSFKPSLFLRRPASPAVSDFTPRPYPGCAENADDGGSPEPEPPGSRTGADSEPPDAYYYAHSKPSYRAFSLEQALTNKWLKIAVKVAFLVAVAATCKSAPRTRTINDLLDDYGIPLAKYLMERLKNRGGVFAAKAQAAYTELLSGDLSAKATSVQAPEPETLASGIDLEQLTIIPVGEQLNLESLPPNVSNLLEITAQPAGDMDNAGTPGEAAGTEVATMLTHDVAAVVDLVAQAAQHLTL
jgi:hypothetical protein